MSYLKKILKEDEEAIRVIRRYPLSFSFKIILAVILIALPFFLMYPLFQWRSWGLIIFALLLLIAFGYSLRVLVVWYFNVFIITSRRVIDIDQRGFFDRTVSGVDYSRIRDVAFHTKGLLQTIFHYGTVLIEIAGTNVRLEIRNIKNPQEVQEIINNLAKFSRENGSTEEFKKLMSELKQNVGSTEIPVKIVNANESNRNP